MFATIVSPPPPRRRVVEFFRALVVAAVERFTRCKTCGGNGTDDVHYYSRCPKGGR